MSKIKYIVSEWNNFVEGSSSFLQECHTEVNPGNFRTNGVKLYQKRKASLERIFNRLILDKKGPRKNFSYSLKLTLWEMNEPNNISYYTLFETSVSSSAMNISKHQDYENKPAVEKFKILFSD